MRQEKHLLRQSIEMITSAGGTMLDVDKSSRHIKIKFRYKGEKYTRTVPISASDRRTYQNAISQLRRIIGRDNLVTRPEGKGTKKRRG